MNNRSDIDQDDYRSFLVMSELEDSRPRSQREIASSAGIALGLINSYLKNLAIKGFVQIKAYPRNRYAYLLTPAGFAEKSRLAFLHLSNFDKLYRATRQDSTALFRALRDKGVKSVTFCGVDEFTEISYLSLREAQMELCAVMDDEGVGQQFIDVKVLSLEEGLAKGNGHVVVTSLKRIRELKEKLLKLGANSEKIYAPAKSFAEVVG